MGKAALGSGFRLVDDGTTPADVGVKWKRTPADVGVKWERSMVTHSRGDFARCPNNRATVDGLASGMSG